MKAKFFILLLLLALPLFVAFRQTRSGDPIQPVVQVKPSCLWDDIGDLTVAQSALAATARDYSEVWTDLADNKTVKWTAPEDVDYVEFRFETDAAADSDVVNIYVAAGATMRDGTTESQFTLAATLTLTGGLGTGTESNVFCDTLAVTASEGILIADDAVDDSGAYERFAVWRCPLRGYKKVVIIATTLQATTTLHVHARYY